MINNQMASGRPADEYNARAEYYETHCKNCGTETDKTELYENDGICDECVADYILDQEQKHGEK